MIDRRAGDLPRGVAARSSTCAWIVTSSAVVGSSAMITSGSLAIAIAIITRWRMPPENSCGKALARCGGVRDADERRAARPRARTPPALPTSWWISTASAIWSPIDVDRRQRRERVLEDHRDLAAADLRQLACPAAPSSSWPCSRTEPVTVADGGSRPMTASDETDLPEPGLADDAEHLAAA